MLAVELGSPGDKLVDAVVRFLNREADHVFVAESVSGHQGVVDMFFVGIQGIHHGGDASLGKGGGCFIGLGFGNDADAAFGSHFQGIAQTGDTGSDDQEINMFLHTVLFYRDARGLQCLLAAESPALSFLWDWVLYPLCGLSPAKTLLSQRENRLGLDFGTGFGGFPRPLAAWPAA